MSDWHTQNWSGHVTLGAARFHRPTSVREVQQIVRQAAKVRVVGSRHCFNDIADTSGDLVWLGDLDIPVAIDPLRRTATVHAGMTYEALCPQLHAAGLALPNLASLKHVTVAGACMTATHGSGDTLGNLATAVSGLEMVTADGELVWLTREKDGDTFRGAIVSLGAIGVVTRLTLDLEPAFLVQQDTYERMPFDEAFAHFEEITASGYSVSLFPTWQKDWIESTWVKRQVPDLKPVQVPAILFGAELASARPSDSPAYDRVRTPYGSPGPWHERLPHYALNEPQNTGDELQSEYFVPRRHAVAAMKAIIGLRKDLAPILGCSEIRTIRADDLWLSSAYSEDTVGIHFNWLKKWESIGPFLPMLESALAPFRARPHLGKLFALSPARLAEVYPRWQDFRGLVRRFDPTGKFSNRYVEKYILGAPGA